MWKVRDRLGLVGGPSGGLRRVEGPSGRSGTGRGTHGKIRDGSRDPRRGPADPLGGPEKDWEIRGTL